MSRYRYTIALGIILVLVVGFVLWRAGEAHACRAAGGHFVRDFSVKGWTCLR